MAKKKREGSRKQQDDVLPLDEFLDSGRHRLALLYSEGSDYASLELGGSCDNDCLFCNEIKGIIPIRNNITIEQQLGQLSGSFKKIVFCELEPTLDPNLPELIRYVKRGGLDVALTTNARKLRDPEYARLLIDAGIDMFILSIHGGDEIIHDLLTRSNGSFNDSVQGLKNLLALKADHHVSNKPKKDNFGLMINFVITKANVRSLQSSVRFFSDISSRALIDRINFTTIIPRMKGEENYEMLMPRYEDILEEFGKVAKVISDASDEHKMPKVTLSGLPFCSFNYHKFEKGLLDIPMIIPKEDEFSELRSKQAFCSACRFDRSCRGIWKKHLDSYPSERFRPVE